jgi:hypothetical protein
MKTNSLLNRKVKLALGAAILALLVLGATSYCAIASSTESDRVTAAIRDITVRTAAEKHLTPMEAGTADCWRRRRMRTRTERSFC